MFKLPFKLSKEKNKDVFATIDIGNLGVKCLTFNAKDYGETGKLRVTGVGTELLEENSVRAGNIVELEKVINGMDNALYKATQAHEDPITDVIFGISGDLCINQATTIRATRKDSEEDIDTREIEKLDIKITEAALEKTQEVIYRRTGNPEPDIRLITSSKIYSKLDGSQVHSLLNKQGKKIEIATFTSFAYSYHLKNLEKVAKELGVNILAAVPTIYSVVQTLRKLPGHALMDAIIIDIGSDTTDIAVVFGGGIVNTKTLAIGGNHFTRLLSQKEGLTFMEAERKKHMYTQGQLEEKENVIIENTLDEAANLWLSGIETLFSDFSGIKTFASDVYILGGGSKLPFLYEKLKTNPWTRTIPFKEPPKFYQLNSKDITHVSDTTGKAEVIEFWPAQALSMIYLEMQNYD